MTKDKYLSYSVRKKTGPEKKNGLSFCIRHLALFFEKNKKLIKSKKVLAFCEGVGYNEKRQGKTFSRCFSRRSKPKQSWKVAWKAREAMMKDGSPDWRRFSVPI